MTTPGKKENLEAKKRSLGLEGEARDSETSTSDESRQGKRGGRGEKVEEMGKSKVGPWIEPLPPAHLETIRGGRGGIISRKNKKGV